MLGAEEPVIRAASVLAADIDGEVVALDVAKGLCYALDPIGSRIWDLLATPASARSISDVLVGTYEVDLADCERDVLRLLEDLVGEGLAVLPARTVDA
jgi:hypothetical protein